MFWGGWNVDYKFFMSDLNWTLARAGADDKPLRMVKTVLHELVKLRGTAIKGHLSMVPIDMEPQPIILAYIDLNLQVSLIWVQLYVKLEVCWLYMVSHLEWFFLYFYLYQTLAAARMLTPSGPGGQTHWGDSASNSPSPATHSADAQLKVLIELPLSLIVD